MVHLGFMGDCGGLLVPRDVLLARFLATGEARIRADDDAGIVLVSGRVLESC